MSVFPPPQIQYKLTLMKRQQRRANWLSMWRSCAIVFLAAGLGLVVTLPDSQIKDKGQIEVDGEQLVSEDKIYQTLNFDYPQFVWKVNGIDLAHKIESIPSIEAVRVRKQIVPPSIVIAVREKTPVALATSRGQVGFLNSQGEWIERQFYDNINGDFSLPELKVIDYQKQFQPAWSKIYQLIQLYPQLQISEIRWQDSGGIFLQAKIGRVFLGSQRSRLSEQFKTISKLENLSDRVDDSEIAYIDLSSPGVNLIQKY